MSDDNVLVPTWGYQPDGDAKIFDLAPGADLPDGWEASPACITNPDLATADALSAVAVGREYVPPSVSPVSAPPADTEASSVDPDALANALAEIERLRSVIATGSAENERLVAELNDADKAHEAGATALDALITERDALKGELDAAAADAADLRQRLAAAEGERDAVKADLEALTAPDAAAKPAKGK